MMLVGLRGLCRVGGGGGGAVVNGGDGGGGVVEVGCGGEGGPPDSAVGRVLPQVAHRTVGDLKGIFGDVIDDLVEGDGDGGGFASGKVGFVKRGAGGIGILGVDLVVVGAGAGVRHCGVACEVTHAIEVADADGVGGITRDMRTGTVGDGPGAATVCADRLSRAEGDVVRGTGVVQIDVGQREAGDCLAEGEGNGDVGAQQDDGGGAHHRDDAGPPVDHGGPGVDDEVAAAAGARSGVALRVLDAGEVHADGVLGAFDAAAGRVGGCPDPAVGAHRRQSAQRAFAGVVLNVVEIEAGDALAEGEGDGGGFASAQA